MLSCTYLGGFFKNKSATNLSYKWSRFEFFLPSLFLPLLLLLPPSPRFLSLLLPSALAAFYRHFPFLHLLSHQAANLLANNPFGCPKHAVILDRLPLARRQRPETLLQLSLQHLHDATTHAASLPLSTSPAQKLLPLCAQPTTHLALRFAHALENVLRRRCQAFCRRRR